MKKPLLITVIAALLFALACVTVNVYFPAAEVQSAADKIVGEVRGTPPSATESESGAKESMLQRSLRTIIPFESVAYAQADINITTPNIRALKEAMKKRFESLLPLYEQGVIGETNDGLLSIRTVEGLGLKEKADAKKQVEAENKDRESLYDEIIKANDTLSSADLPEVKRLFANSWQKDAKKGWWIQNEDGEWKQKGAE